MKQPRKLHVKRTTTEELSGKWTIDVRSLFKGQRLYVRCNAKGVVTNWDIATVYTDTELVNKSQQIVIL